MANVYNVYDQSGKSIYSGSNANKYKSAVGGSGFATLQTPVATANAANQVNANFSPTGINNVQLPSWLSPNADSQMSELLSAYGGIQSAFDPTAQVEARNNAIGYNTAAGGQAANNAATEYVNRAAQSGASTLGAGVVKAQSMMPVLQQNAALKTEAADIAAKSHQEAATLASQVAGTIGNLRTSYLQTLTGFAQGQQQLDLEAYKANQAAASSAADREYQYAALREQTRQQGLTSQQQKDNSAMSAAQLLLGSKAPGGSWGVGNQGQTLYGQTDRTADADWRTSRSRAINYLGGLL